MMPLAAVAEAWPSLRKHLAAAVARYKPVTDESTWSSPKCTNQMDSHHPSSHIEDLTHAGAAEVAVAGVPEQMSALDQTSHQDTPRPRQYEA